jgi:membrane protease YdiL (CAAX protease family)
MQNTAKRNVFLYLVLVFAFCTLTYFFHVAALAVMWGPGVAAIVASLLRGRSLKEIGWKVPRIKWLVAGWLIPVTVSFASYGLIWIAGLGTVPNPTFLQRARFTLGMPSQSNGVVIVAAFSYISILGLLPGMIAAIGEEIGWRGFLVPELVKWMSFPKMALVSGAIWCAWHMPAILSGSYGTTDTPRWYQIGCFSTMALSSAVVLAWLRMKSGSIWPVTIMHATHNGVIQAFFDRITKETGHTHFFTGEFGVALAVFDVVLASYCIATAQGLADGRYTAKPVSVEGRLGELASGSRLT